MTRAQKVTFAEMREQGVLPYKQTVPASPAGANRDRSGPRSQLSGRCPPSIHVRSAGRGPKL